MGTESKPWLIWLTAFASAAVHAGAAAGVVAFGHALPSGDAATISEVDFVVLDLPEESPAPEPLVDPLPLPEEPPRLASLVRDRAAEHPLSTAVEEHTLLPEPEPRPEEEEERERERRQPMVSLDPTSVAAASVVFDDDPSPPRPQPPASGRGERSEEALEAQLGGALQGAANARPHVSHRPPPRLRARTDGSYAFHGHLFDAVIARDGRVRFSDRGGVEMNSPNLGPNGLIPSGTFDVTDSIERARGNDPFRYERDWFMRQTRELRERLEDESSAREQQHGMAALRGSLRRIWGGRGTDPQRRARIFSLWDDCAEDEVGHRARAAIIGFVRETLPQGSPGAFTEGELRRLNAERLSREPFAPY